MKKKPPRRVAVGYCRVSTPRQAQRGISLRVQEAQIKRLCQAKGWALGHVYADRGKSGRRLRGRRGLADAIAHVCRQRGVLVVYSVSRMSRSLKDVFALTERLDKCGAELVSVTEPIDTTGAIGRAFFAVAAVFAQLESELTGERVADAIADTVERLGYRRDGVQPLGFRIGRGRRVAVPREQAIVRSILDMRRKKMTFAEIARRLNSRRVPTQTKLRRYRSKRKSAWHGKVISRMLRRMGRARPARGGGRPWTDEELALLGTDTDQAIAERLGRRRDVVTRKRRRLRIASKCRTNKPKPSRPPKPRRSRV